LCKHECELLTNEIPRGVRIPISVHINGSFPCPLYRAFDKEEYACSFVEQGIFQLRLLSRYCAIEDEIRKDRDEGVGRLVINTNRPVVTIDKNSGDILSQTDEYGPVYFSTSAINHRYILCFSGPEVDLEYLASQYGKYVVCLNQPNELVSDIAHYLEQNPIVLGDTWLDCVQVRYDKGLLISELPEPASEERLSLSYAQKAPEFNRDCEYRLVLTPSFAGNSPKAEIKFELHKRLECAEIL